MCRAVGKPAMRHRVAIRDYRRDRWRTWQMPARRLKWVELKTDFTESYLEGLKG